MTREAKLMSGITLIIVPTIQYGGLLSADIFDEQEQRIYGESFAAEFSPWSLGSYLSRGTCSCRCHRDSLAHLSDACRFSHATDFLPLVHSNCSAVRCCSNFCGVLLFRASPDCDSNQWSGIPDLPWSSCSCRDRRFARHGLIKAV